MLTVEFSIRRAFGLGILLNSRVLRFLVGPLDIVHFSTKLNKTQISR